MSATNGSAVSLRRLGGCLFFALALVISAVFASSASAKVTVTHTDLALGDSLAFGYSQELYNNGIATGDPAKGFELGYDNYYFNGSKAKAAGDQLINDGCPGETTDSFIGNGTIGKALDPEHNEAPCAYQEAWNAYHIPGVGGPLHNPYVGESQLEDALGVIKGESEKGTPVTTITMDIGANDELHAIAKCEAEAKPAEEKAYEEAYIKALGEGKSSAEAEAAGKAAAEAAGKKSVKECVESHASEIFKHILENIGKIMFAIRKGTVFGGVNYEGKVVFQGGYDPYGNVFGTGELLEGSNTLASILNFKENKLLMDEGVEAAEEGHEAFHVCFANPQPRFDPGTKSEPTRLQAWTNMANFTEFEYEPGKFLKYGEKVTIAPGDTRSADGPDIHPTPAGYHTLADSVMKPDCGPVE